MHHAHEGAVGGRFVAADVQRDPVHARVCSYARADGAGNVRGEDDADAVRAPSRRLAANAQAHVLPLKQLLPQFKEASEVIKGTDHVGQPKGREWETALAANTREKFLTPKFVASVLTLVLAARLHNLSFGCGGWGPRVRLAHDASARRAHHVHTVRGHEDVVPQCLAVQPQRLHHVLHVRAIERKEVDYTGVGRALA